MRSLAKYRYQSDDRYMKAYDDDGVAGDTMVAYDMETYAQIIMIGPDMQYTAIYRYYTVMFERMKKDNKVIVMMRVEAHKQFLHYADMNFRCVIGVGYADGVRKSIHIEHGGVPNGMFLL